MTSAFFWLFVDAVMVGAFMMLTILAMFAGNTAVAVGAGLLMLFWQREYHRDVEGRP